jgi:hypothetical protein
MAWVSRINIVERYDHIKSFSNIKETTLRVVDPCIAFVPKLLEICRVD